MATPVYDVDYFIAKFTAIPEEKWTTNTLKDRNGKCCARGLCGERFENERPRVTQESVNLCQLFGSGYNVIVINDDEYHQHYPQSTPKQRILAALNDIKLKGTVNVK